MREPVADELFAAAETILELRARCQLDTRDCVAARYRDACRRYVDLDDHHRPGPRQQALALLRELGEAD